MKQRTDQEDLIVRYFFEELSEKERDEIEIRFLTDNAFFEQMLSVEDALVDSYVQGQLADYERRKVEDGLLSSSWQARELDFTKDLIDDLARTEPANLKGVNSVWVKRPSRWQSFLIFLGIRDSGNRLSLVLLFLLVFAFAVAVWNLILQNRFTQIQSKQIALEKENEELRRNLNQQTDWQEKLAQEINDERIKGDQLEQKLIALYEEKTLAPPGTTTTISLTDNSFARGNGKIKIYLIRPTIRQIQIKIANDEESNFKGYEAIIKTFDGHEIWSKGDLIPRLANRNRIVFTIPAKLFANENYTLTLKGKTENGDIVNIGDYSFRIKK